ncbi:MarR family transcriptional regulator [Bowmanella denitrificans]|uniref:MarR family transcriptional regulator n=1 Tax=Bowmanella denitrificans TaxID=366582 RepID=A0ABN0WTE8_9ALTE
MPITVKQADDDDLDVFAHQWRTEGIEGDLLPMKVIGRMFRLMKTIEAEVGKCHEAFDLKYGEFDVLATLRRTGAPHCLTPSQLHQSMLLSSGAMTNRLDKLEQKGLIARTHSQEDRRSVKVQLTDKGMQTIEAVFPCHLKTLRQLLGNLDDASRERLVGSLKQWLAAIQD